MGYYKTLYTAMQEARNPYFSGDRAREWARARLERRVGQ